MLKYKLYLLIFGLQMLVPNITSLKSVNYSTLEVNINVQLKFTGEHELSLSVIIVLMRAALAV